MSIWDYIPFIGGREEDDEQQAPENGTQATVLEQLASGVGSGLQNIFGAHQDSEDQNAALARSLGATQGLTFNTADEMYGLGDALLRRRQGEDQNAPTVNEGIGQLLTGLDAGSPGQMGRGAIRAGEGAVQNGVRFLSNVVDPETYGPAYERFRDRRREQLHEAEQANPAGFAMGQAVGSLPWMLAPGAAGTKAAQGVGALGRTGLAAAEAGGYGLLAGAGASEGDSGRDVLADSVRSGVGSAAFGGALSGIANAAAPAARWLSRTANLEGARQRLAHAGIPLGNFRNMGDDALIEAAETLRSRGVNARRSQASFGDVGDELAEKGGQQIGDIMRSLDGAANPNPLMMSERGTIHNMPASYLRRLVEEAQSPAVRARANSRIAPDSDQIARSLRREIGMADTLHAPSQLADNLTGPATVAPPARAGRAVSAPGPAEVQAAGSVDLPTIAPPRPQAPVALPIADELGTAAGKRIQRPQAPVALPLADDIGTAAGKRIARPQPIAAAGEDGMATMLEIPPVAHQPPPMMAQPPAARAPRAAPRPPPRSVGRPETPGILGDDVLPTRPAIGPSGNEFLDRIVGAVDRGVTGLDSGSGSARRAVRNLIERHIERSGDRSGNLSPSAIMALRQNMDDLAGDFARQGRGIRQNAFRTARGEAQNVLNEIAGEAGGGAGRQAYERARGDFRLGRLLQDAAARESARAPTRGVATLGDQAGALVGGAVLGDPRAALGAGILSNLYRGRRHGISAGIGRAIGQGAGRVANAAENAHRGVLPRISGMAVGTSEGSPRRSAPAEINLDFDDGSFWNEGLEPSGTRPDDTDEDDFWTAGLEH